MSPDNFVQDPQNSQNFNRYAYCLNNPLMYTDPSGKVFQIGIIGAVAIGAAIAATSYTIYALATTWDNFSWGGLLKSTVIGAVSGAFSFGVGSMASAIIPNASTFGAHVAKAAIQATGHGFTQGVITGVSGGDFYQGFWAAAVSSVVSSAVPALGNQVNFIAKNETMATLFFGTVSGGLSAELTGGNFWQGAATGLVVSGLNHVAHKMTEPKAQTIAQSEATPECERCWWLNNDEYLTAEEGIWHYRLGGGEPVNVRLNKLDLSNVRVSDFKNSVLTYQGNPMIYANFDGAFYTNLDQAIVYGNVGLVYLGDNTIMALPDYYDFDLKLNYTSWKGYARDFATLMGAQWNGVGTPYHIQFIGTAKIGN